MNHEVMEHGIVTCHCPVNKKSCLKTRVGMSWRYNIYIYQTAKPLRNMVNIISSDERLMIPVVSVLLQCFFVCYLLIAVKI